MPFSVACFELDLWYRCSWLPGKPVSRKL